MESAAFNTNRLLWIVAATGLCAGLVAFNQKQQKPQVNAKPQVKNLDTIPKKKERKIINLDEALDDTYRKKIDIDIDNLNVDLSEISPLIEKEIANAKTEVNNAMKEIDAVELKKEIEEVKEIYPEKINADMKELNKALNNIKPDLEIGLKNIKIEMDKVNVELKEYKSFIDGLENDGLIIKKEGYTIKHKNGELIINGKIQPAGVYSKYRGFLEKHKTVNIENSGDDFNIDHN
jgi:hypothetical protein